MSPVEEAAVALVKAKIVAKGKPRVSDKDGRLYWRSSWTRRELELFDAVKAAGLLSPDE